MANSLRSEASCSGGEDWCLPGLELQHDMHIPLKDWASLGAVTQSLFDAGADVHALSLSRHAGAFVLKCRVKSITAAEARAFIDGLSRHVDGAASVEHLLLAKAPDHACA